MILRIASSELSQLADPLGRTCVKICSSNILKQGKYLKHETFYQVSAKRYTQKYLSCHSFIIS